MYDNMLFVLISTTHKNQERILSVKNTWAKHMDHLYYSDHYDADNNIIKVSDDDCYTSNEEKGINILNSLKNIKKNNEYILDLYKWMYFVDDDTFVNYKLVFTMIKDFDEDNVYGYILNKNNNTDNPIFKHKDVPSDFSYIAGGTGFFISSKTVKQINFKNFKFGYTDVSMGFNFRNNNIKLVNKDNCCRDYSKLNNINDMSHLYSFHYVTTYDSMIFLYNNI
jgi:hypothetical protein